MRFTWFNLMPWPYLPDDFRQQNRSVWVDIPGKLYDPRKGHFVYHEYMDQLEYADALGFDGIGVNEHHQNGYGLMPSPNIIAAGLARRTSRAAICVIGNSIALYNPPIRVAEEFAMLDVISGGRLIAGFPVGTPMDTNFCYGQIPALTRDKYYEAHELIMRAWKEDEPFAFDGKYTQLRYVNCWPKPIQRPHPPIYIPGGGSVETWDFCADFDYNYSYLSFTGYVRGKQFLDGFWEHVAAKGKDASPYRAARAQIICVADPGRRGGPTTAGGRSRWRTDSSPSGRSRERRRAHERQAGGDETGRPGPGPGGRKRCAGRVPARRGRLPAREPLPRRAGDALPRLRARAARLRRVDGRGVARGHARLRASRLGRGGRTRARAAAPRRALHGRHDRGRDGCARAERLGEAGARERRRSLDPGASDPRPLRPSPSRIRPGALPRPRGGGGAPHGRPRLHQPAGAGRLLHRQLAAHGDRGQDPLPHPQPASVEATLPRGGRDAGPLGQAGPAHPAGLRGAVDPADPRRAARPDRRGRAHAPLRAAEGVRLGGGELPRLSDAGDGPLRPERAGGPRHRRQPGARPREGARVRPLRRGRHDRQPKAGSL